MDKKKIVLQGSGSGITHVINNDEKEQFVEHINMQLKNDPQIGDRFPIDEYSMDIFEQCKGKKKEIFFLFSITNNSFNISTIINYITIIIIYFNLNYYI